MSDKQKTHKKMKNDKLDSLKSKKMAKEIMLKVATKVDTYPPNLIPDFYLKPRILANQIARFTDDSHRNILLLSQINRTKGLVDCWADTKKLPNIECLRKIRITQMKALQAENKEIYNRIEYARSIHSTRKELLQDWKKTLQKMKRMTLFPFLVPDKSVQEFIGLSSDRKFWMEFGSNDQLLGRVVISLFDKVCPLMCEVFKSLVKGDTLGHAYSGTAVFSIIPGMYCSLGDVTNNNGFGGIILDQNTSAPENFLLKHSVPGILSMKIFNDNKIKGIFNLTFKPMELLDGKNVVFGRVVGGSSNLLSYLSRMGTPLGMPRDKPHVSSCGWIDSKNKYRRGAVNRFVAS